MSVRNWASIPCQRRRRRQSESRGFSTALGGPEPFELLHQAGRKHWWSRRKVIPVIARRHIIRLAIRRWDGEGAGHERQRTTADDQPNGDILPPGSRATVGTAVVLTPTPAGQAALAAAQALAKQAAAPATLRAYKADWTHFARLVRRARLRPRAGSPRHRRRLPRQPGRQPRADDHPPAAVGPGQNAPVQRPGVEPGASRHPGPAAGRAADASPVRCRRPRR